MKSNTEHWQSFSSSKVITLSPRGVPFMPGVGLILLGTVIFLAPKFFLAAIAMFFVLLGVACCYVAWKFMSFKKHVQQMAESFQSSVDINAFNAQNDDIDITDTESKKILFH
jgi:uncharacterized membrane protein YobD (UPF0266 family)